jgi:hypothetical protein
MSCSQCLNWLFNRETAVAIASLGRINLLISKLAGVGDSAAIEKNRKEYGLQFEAFSL